MRTIKLTLASFVLLVPCTLTAQTYKCTDANGRITYSGKICSDLGLKDAGEVKGQIQMTPAYQPPPRTGGMQTSPPASAPAGQAPAPAPEPGAAAESDDPARRCFTVKTAKGNVTRCNDTPPDSDAPPGNP